MSDGAKYEQLVRDFCDAWADGDHDKVVEYFTADGVYHNIPVDPMVGHEAIRMMIEGFTAVAAHTRSGPCNTSEISRSSRTSTTASRRLPTV